MILQKVLAAGRAAAARKVLSPASDVMAVTKRTKIIATPAENKISTAEKIFLSLLISCSISAIPVWVICHIREYGGN